MRPNPKTTLPLLLFFIFSLPLPARPSAPAAAAVAGEAASSAGVEAGAPDAARGVAEALAPAAVPAPRLVHSAEAQARLGSEREDADDEATDSPEIAAEVDEESAEMEAVRRAEESAHVGEAPSAEEHPGEGGRIDLLPELDCDLAALQAQYDIPIDVNPAVVAYVRFFQSPGVRPHFVKWLGRSHRYLDRYRQIMREEGLPEDTVYLAMIESGFGNFAYSRARASGPWQFIAGTGRLFGLKDDFWVDERRDPERSAHAAAKYLKRLYEQTGDWRLAWAGYNAGVGRVLSAQRKGLSDFWSMAGVPGKRVLRPETKGYVPKLMAAAIIAKHPDAFGFMPDEIEPEEWADYTEVEIPSATLLSVVARAAAVPERAIIDLNPELRRTCTPPRKYTLKIPVTAADAFAEAWPALRAKVRTTFAGHVIRKGDTLARVAAMYGVPVQGIIEMNNLRDTRHLRVGTELIIPRPLAGGAVEARTPEDPPQRSAAPRARPATSLASSRGRPDRTVHRVRSGDTLWSISQKYGVEVEDICRWNGIRSPNHYKLLSGKRLVLYAGRS
ncbi:MAG TPA: LysM peptidoglycan-binding domain-containing protein [Anaeromyxobacter sp.]|nr:LysM peptidoglycan-binding domain-containing protein [Anaeromyxobacter sp.]